MGNIIALETGIRSNARDVTARTFIVPADEEYESTPSRFFHFTLIDATTATRGSTSGALLRGGSKTEPGGLIKECRAASNQVYGGSSIRIAAVFPLAQAFTPGKRRARN